MSMEWKPAWYEAAMREEAEAASACSEFGCDDDPADDGGPEMLGRVILYCISIAVIGCAAALIW